MKIYRITQVRQFMSALLSGGVFQDFVLVEAKVQAQVSFTLEGHYRGLWMKENGLEAPAEEYLPWTEAAPHIYQWIKGKHAPDFQFFLRLSAKTRTELFPGLEAIPELHIRFREGALLLYGAVSHPTFSLGKEDDTLWEEWLERFLKNQSFSFEEALQ